MNTNTNNPEQGGGKKECPLCENGFINEGSYAEPIYRPCEGCNGKGVISADTVINSAPFYCYTDFSGDRCTEQCEGCKGDEKVVDFTKFENNTFNKRTDPAKINKEEKQTEFTLNKVEDLTEEEIIPLVEAYFDIITNTSKADRELLKPEVVGKMKIKYWEIAYDCWYHSRSHQEATIKQLQEDYNIQNYKYAECVKDNLQLQNRIAELERRLKCAQDDKEKYCKLWEKSKFGNNGRP